jgi:hypothetical protein
MLSCHFLLWPNSYRLVLGLRTTSGSATSSGKWASACSARCQCYKTYLSTTSHQTHIVYLPRNTNWRGKHSTVNMPIRVIWGQLYWTFTFRKGLLAPSIHFSGFNSFRQLVILSTRIRCIWKGAKFMWTNLVGWSWVTWPLKFWSFWE